MTLPFDDWLRAGVMQLGLSPAEVWATTLTDLRALTAPTDTLPSDAFAALCTLFPDDGDPHG